MTSTPDQQTPDGPPVIVIDGVPRSAADLRALAHDQATVISDLLEAKFAHTIDDYWLTDDGTAFLRYNARGGGILWEVSIKTARAATLARTMKASQDDQHDTELAEARNEIDQARRELAAAQARIAELEAAGRTAPRARASGPPLRSGPARNTASRSRMARRCCSGDGCRPGPGTPRSPRG